MINLSPHSYTLKRSKIFPVILVMSALAAETAFASWFPQRVGRRMSRMTPASVGASAAVTQRRRQESQIHRVWGRPTGSIRPPVIVLQKVTDGERKLAEAQTERQTDRQTDRHKVKTD